jgi:hypothetical protein
LRAAAKNDKQPETQIKEAVMAGWADNLKYDDSPARKRDIQLPAGYEDESEFLDEMRVNYENGVSFDEHNILAARDDARNVIGKQWDDYVEQERRRANKPTLTFNRLVAFIAQIIGNRLMNETEIRVYPDKAGTKDIALIREGIIRSIYKNSHADLARDEAHKYQVIGGQGAFCLSIDYSGDDVFEQEIKLKPVFDPYSAIFDPLGIDPTGGDCEWGFVADEIPIKTYKKRWPWASLTAFDASSLWDTNSYWMRDETIRIVSYWRMTIDGFKTLALFKDGTTRDVTDMEEWEYSTELALRKDGRPYIREVPNRFAQLYICSGKEILEGPYNYPISSIPIYRVPGWQVSDGERTYRWGLVRFLKDPQRLHNYWRSVVAEQLIAAPRNKYLTTPDAIKGHEDRWRMAATSDDPFLYYNDGETVPVHIPPPGIDSALLTEAGSATQDLKDISNIHEAALGMPSNEVSKVAIQQRQQVSDVGSFIYSDRLRLADERCAKNINELIPYIYDTERVVTTVGVDGKTALMLINSGQNNDVTLGKYGVTVTVGPATVTKRQLAAEQMTAFMNAIGPAAEKYLDLYAEAQDFPNSEEWARRARLALPPGTIPEDEMTPEQVAGMQQAAQVQQLQQQLAQAEQEAKIAKLTADAANAEARARLAESQAYKAKMDADAKMMDIESKVEDREHQQVMGAVEQHNKLVGEDRDFDDRVEERKTRNGERKS